MSINRVVRVNCHLTSLVTRLDNSLVVKVELLASSSLNVVILELEEGALIVDVNTSVYNGQAGVVNGRARLAGHQTKRLIGVKLSQNESGKESEGGRRKVHREGVV